MIVTAIEMYRAESLLVQFQTDPATDITGYNFVWTLAEAPDMSRKIVRARTCPLITPATGLFGVTIARTDSDIRPRAYFWDVWRVDAGFERIWGAGSFTIKPVALRP